MVVNSSGCGSHLKELGWLLGDERAEAFSAKVRDVGELLADVPASCAPASAAADGRAPGLVPPPPRAAAAALVERVARAHPGLEVVEPAEQDLCCGSAGIYNVVQADAARELGDRKAAHVLATGAQAYASANPGLSRPGLPGASSRRQPLPALHPIELVDASIRNVGSGRLRATARR